MKKRYRKNAFVRGASLLIASCILIGGGTGTVLEAGAAEIPLITPETEQIDTLPESDFKVRENDTGVIITSCLNTSSSRIRIPDMIGGKPVTEIDTAAFKNCGKNLKKVIIPETVTRIGQRAFEETALSSIELPKNLKRIESNAFLNCDQLKDISFPDGLEYVGYDVFDGTPWYASQPDGVVYVSNVCYKYKGDMPENTTVSLKSSTVSVSTYAFSREMNLSEVTFPDSLISIGEYSFSNTNLESITLPDSIKNIGRGAFMGCKALESAKLPRWMNTIEWSLFAGCKSLSYVKLPKNLSTIKYSAFDGCESLGELDFPDSLQYVDERALRQTLWLSNQPDGVVYAGRDAYTYKGEMPPETSIELREGTISITPEAFQGQKNLKKLTLPSSLKVIGLYAFQATGLKSVTIPPSVRTIGRYSIGYGDWYDTFTEYRAAYPVKGFVIFGEKGSRAESFAKQYGGNIFERMLFATIPTGTSTLTDSSTGVSATGMFGDDMTMISSKSTKDNQLVYAFSLAIIDDYYSYNDVKDAFTERFDYYTVDNMTNEKNKIIKRVFKATTYNDEEITVTLPIKYMPQQVMEYVEETDEEGITTSTSRLITDGQLTSKGYSFKTKAAHAVYHISQSYVSILGDVNGDNSVNVSDSLMIARYDAGLAQLDENQIQAGNVNGDDKTDIADALLIARLDAGLITEF